VDFLDLIWLICFKKDSEPRVAFVLFWKIFQLKILFKIILKELIFFIDFKLGKQLHCFYFSAINKVLELVAESSLLLIRITPECH